MALLISHILLVVPFLVYLFWWFYLLAHKAFPNGVWDVFKMFKEKI